MRPAWGAGWGFGSGGRGEAGALRVGQGRASSTCRAVSREARSRGADRGHGSLVPARRGYGAGWDRTRARVLSGLLGLEELCPRSQNSVGTGDVLVINGVRTGGFSKAGLFTQPNEGIRGCVCVPRTGRSHCTFRGKWRVGYNRVSWFMRLVEAQK